MRNDSIRTTAEMTFVPSGVDLDFGAGQMVIRGVLARRPGESPPKQVWVWAYFMNPSEKVNGEPVGGSRSDEPIELSDPFGAGDTVRVVARGPFHWATNPDAPRTGYYARVWASARSPDEAEVPVRQRDYNVDQAIRVASSGR